MRSRQPPVPVGFRPRCSARGQRPIISCGDLLNDIKISLYRTEGRNAMSGEPLTFIGLTGTLKAAGEATRLRILAMLTEAELTVSDLTEILRQSQPRLSRHLRLLAEAGLVERFREGSWAFFRLGEHGSAADVARTLIARLDAADPAIGRDRERLAAVRTARTAAAQNYFRRHAAQWDRIRKLHIADAAIEDAIRTALNDKPIRALLDLGTGTGRMLEL